MRNGLWVAKNGTRKAAGTSLVVQWLRLHASTAGGAGLTLSQGTKIPHAAWCGQKKKKKKKKSNSTGKKMMVAFNWQLAHSHSRQTDISGLL